MDFQKVAACCADTAAIVRDEFHGWAVCSALNAMFNQETGTQIRAYFHFSCDCAFVCSCAHIRQISEVRTIVCITIKQGHTKLPNRIQVLDRLH